MKITKQKLKQIITEELKNVLNEYSGFSRNPGLDYTPGVTRDAFEKQKSKPAKDEDLEDIRDKVDNLERVMRSGETGSLLDLRRDDLNKAIDNYKGPNKDKAEMFRVVADPVDLTGGQSTAPTQYTDAAGTLPGSTSGMSRVGAPPLGGEVSGSRTASGLDGGGASTKTTTKTKKVRRKVRKGRHDVKFQRMINRMEKAGDLSKSDWSKISRINVKLKDPARAKELFNQITGKTQKKMKRDAAKLGLAGGIEDAGKNIRTDGSIDKKAIARTEQNAIELAQASDRPRLAKAIQRLQRRLKDAKKELKIQADAEREFGGGTVSPAATKAQLRVDYLEGRLSKIVQSTFERLKDAK